MTPIMPAPIPSGDSCDSWQWFEHSTRSRLPAQALRIERESRTHSHTDGGWLCHLCTTASFQSSRGCAAQFCPTQRSCGREIAPAGGWQASTPRGAFEAASLLAAAASHLRLQQQACPMSTHARGPVAGPAGAPGSAQAAIAHAELSAAEPQPTLQALQGPLEGPESGGQPRLCPGCSRAARCPCRPAGRLGPLQVRLGS